MTTDQPLEGTQHLEIFTSKRTGDGIHVPCWCAIGHDHTYADWKAAGSPDTTGKPTAYAAH